MTIATARNESFYIQEGDLYVPTGLGVSPWTERTQSGVSVAGLLAHLLEQVPTPVPMTPVRLTTDIFGAVPITVLRGSVRSIRNGRRVQVVEAELRGEDRVWARMTLLRMRIKATPPIAEAQPSPYPSEQERATAHQPAQWVNLINVRGEIGQPGSGASWVRITGEVVAGHAATPMQRLVMVSDFGTGIGGPLAAEEWTMANVDISLHLSRLPEGEWLYIETDSVSAGNGVAVAHSALGDRTGIVARGSQSLFIEQRVRSER